MAGFDPTVFLSNLAWLKPELFMTILGFVLLALAVAVPKELRWSIGIIALVGLVIATVLVAAYFPAVPFGGPKMEPGMRAGAFAEIAVIRLLKSWAMLPAS